MTLYYGVEGPGYTPDFFPVTWFDGSAMDTDKMIACEHILLSDIYAQDFSAAVAGTTGTFRTWARTNVTGVTTGLELIPGSMRAKVSPWVEGIGDSRFTLAPDSFKTYVMDTGWDSAHNTTWQRIMFAEPNGKAKLTKSASRKEWL